MADPYQALYRRYRSKRFGELRGQDHVVRALRTAVAEGRVGHAYLFSGPRGTGKTRLALDAISGDYKPVAEFALPKLDYIADVARCHAQGRYREGMQVFLAAPGDEAALARKVIAGYIAYAFQRVGEVSDSIGGIDRILAMGFNWAPPSVLVDVMGAGPTVRMIEQAGLAVPTALAEAARSGVPKRFFQHPQINIGRFFVAN